MKSVVNCYVSLGLGYTKEKQQETSLVIYKNSFEEELRHQTEAYYTQESAQFISTNTVVDYTKKVEARLNEENRRVDQYLHHDSRTELLSCCETVLIKRHLETLWQEIPQLLQDEKVEGKENKNKNLFKCEKRNINDFFLNLDLARMYKLLNCVPNGLAPLRNELEKHVQSEGLKAIERVIEEAEKEPKIFVEAIFAVIKRYNDLVSGPFVNDSGFVAALDKACRRFINDTSVAKKAGITGPSRTPELLARYADRLLKKSAKNPEEAEMEQTLTNVMTVFKYIEEKDVFMTFYSKSLAKRLIQGTSASEDMESNMIAKLKVIYLFLYKM